MQNKKYLLIGSIALFVVLLLGGAFMYFGDRLPGGGDVPEGLTDGPAYISDFAVAKPNFVATGENLAKVEVWYVASVGAEPQLLGKAKLAGTENKTQTWTFPIPKQRLAAVDIFARGYDKENTPVARIGLPDVESAW